MLREKARLVATTLAIADLIAMVSAFFAAHALRSRLELGFLAGPGPLLPLDEYTFLLPVGAAAWLLGLAVVGAYRSHRVRTLRYEAGEVVGAASVAAALLVTFLFASRIDIRMLGGEQVSRSFLAIWLSLGMVFAVAVRIWVRTTARRLRRAGKNFRNVLLIGSGSTAQQVMSELGSRAEWGFRLLGLLRFDSDQGTENSIGSLPDFGGVPDLGTIDDLQQILADEVVDEVIITPSRHNHADTLHLAWDLRERGINTSVAFPEGFEGLMRPEIRRIGAVQLIQFSSAPHWSLQLAVKRIVDLMLSGVLLLLLAPMILCVIVAIRATSSGPAIFRQVRVGLNGRRFTLLKFRTMRAGAEKQQDELSARNLMDGPVFKVKNDPRVTPLGSWLRRLSLDEVPQLWNVLTGDMSLVGPRPPVPKEVVEYQPWQRRRLAMRPGLTGLWQVSGRNEVDFQSWIRMDLSYIDHWSLWLDCKILLKTIPAAIGGRGAY